MLGKESLLPRRRTELEVEVQVEGEVANENEIEPSAREVDENKAVDVPVGCCLGRAAFAVAVAVAVGRSYSRGLGKSS
jgi:hypothetical protein